MKSLIKGFNTKTMNKLASSLEYTKKEDANKQLVSLGAVGSGKRCWHSASTTAASTLGARIARGDVSAIMVNAVFDIKNLTKINGLDVVKLNDLAGKLKEYYNLFTEFKKNKGAIQKERNEQKAELAKQKEARR
ncbi:hypothetical protein [Rickettsia australis]|uniref:Uncharacterized protein n=1 Tax=Rickettsia australis (strain Cutlack) TaxID=1105110 RepID=H8K8I8_RICAC|nr:hypothetical protein [Rickettsia australis]AFC71581.1 hypothetical protein MC5_06715 [Rickettsia australis str. Cutlack]